MCDVIEKERREARENEIFSSVAEGDYNAERGAEKLKITVEQFIEKMTQRGFVVPTK